MNHLQRRQTDKLAKGSLADIARQTNTTLAESFINCDALILIDVSGSMANPDCSDHRTRYRAACDELEKLQSQLPGKIAVIAFSNKPEFSPSGFPRFISGGTNLAAGLQFIKVADGCGIKLICISDGEPDDSEEALKVAATFESKIDCIFIGPETSRGADFMRRLAAATGGIATNQAIPALDELCGTVKLLLTA